MVGNDAIVRWNAEATNRPNGRQDSRNNSLQQEEALLDLLILAQTRYFIGTRSSTFSFWAAGMQHTATGHHWMVYPGVYDGCVRASSSYSSLSQFESRFLSMRHFSVLGEVGKVSCFDQELVNRLQAVAGTYNPFIETLEDALCWDCPPAG